MLHYHMKTFCDKELESLYIKVQFMLANSLESYTYNDPKRLVLYIIARNIIHPKNSQLKIRTDCLSLLEDFLHHYV